MKVLLQEAEGQIGEVSDYDDTDSPPPVIPFNPNGPPLEGTAWQDNEHAQQLLDTTTKPAKPMINLPWKKVKRLMRESGISFSLFLFNVYFSLLTLKQNISCI